MLFCSSAVVVIGGVSLIFLSSSVLMFLLSFEFVSIGLMSFCLMIYVGNSFIELFLFMAIIVTESVLGLVLMLLLVSSSGNEFISTLNVS